MKTKSLVFKYVILDFLTASSSWILFFIFRKLYIEPLKFGYEIPISISSKFLLGLSAIPLSWIALYFLTGYYRDVLRKSRLEDVIVTFSQTLIGVFIIFFFLILDDYVSSYKNYYLLFSVLFILHFVLTLIARWILTTISVSNINNRKIGFNTIIIGANEPAYQIYNDLNSQVKSAGNFVIGFVDVHHHEHYSLSKQVPHLGTLDNLEKLVHKHNIQEVIIALNPNEFDQINTIINKLGLCNVIIKVIPEMYSVLSGRVKMDHLYGTHLILLNQNLMPSWQQNIKNLIDILISVIALLITFPLLLFIGIGIKLTSPGPILYSHVRIGQFGKPFHIYKFRSMYINSEINGPELSRKNDHRLTSLGKFLRKYRLDEIPNFLNVIKGDMSLVGPRPEREYYIKQIIKRAPHFIHLQKVKPGITSWGQVKYGYAENVDQMIKRLSYDIMYIENMSLFVDFKILLYTILTIIRGRGL